MNKEQATFSRKRRRHREWLALGLVFLLAAVLLGLMLWHDFQNTSHTERDRLQVQARVVDEYLEQLLGGVNNALQGVREEVPLWKGAEFSARATKRLQALTEAMPGVRFMSIVDRRGVIEANSVESLVGADRSEREFFTIPQARPDPHMLYISEPYVGARGVTSLMVGRVMLDADGSFAGMVYAKLDPDFFGVVMRSVLYAADMRSTLVTQSGQPPRSTAWWPCGRSGRPVFRSTSPWWCRSAAMSRPFICPGSSACGCRCCSMWCWPWCP